MEHFQLQFLETFLVSFILYTNKIKVYFHRAIYLVVCKKDMKVHVFWDVMLCFWVISSWCFKRSQCHYKPLKYLELHIQQHSVTFQKI